MSGRAFWLGLGGIALAALAVRVAYVLVVARHLPLIGDAQTYHLLARNLAHGRGYVRPHELAATGRAMPSAEFPPLFPFLLAAVVKLGGATVTSQKLAMAGLGTGTVLVLGLLGRAVVSPAAGLVAAALAAVHPMLFGIDGALMSETPYVLLIAVTLLAAFWVARAPESRNRWIALGAVIGLAALTRGEALALVALVVVPLAAARRMFVAGSIAVVTTLLVLTPWTARNYIRFHTLVPVSDNTTGVLVGANCPPTYQGRFEGLWLFSCYGRVDVRGLDEPDAFRRYGRAGLSHARHHAGHVPRVMAIRWLRTFGLFRPGQQVSWETLEGRDHRWQTVGTRFEWALYPLAISGPIALRRRRVLIWPLLSTVGLASLTTIATYGNQRFRAAAEPALVVLAAATLVEVTRRIVRRGVEAHPELPVS